MPLLEDGASLLGLSRTDKYNTSLEKVMLALRDRGLGAEGLGHFLDHVSFSWLVGNGDLHAKNSSVLHEIEPGRFGSAPSTVGVRYSPLYDLVNTRILVPGDLFALPVNGKENNLRLGDFQKLAARWGSSREASGRRVTDLADRVSAHLDDVLEIASLATK